MASNFCRNCGFRLTEGKPFCGNCGTRVIIRDAATVQPAPAPAPVEAAPVAAPVEEAPAVVPEEPVSEAKPESPAMPQPLQTLVTYHPEKPVPAEELPPQALQPVTEITAAPVEEPVQPAEILPAPTVAAAPAPAVPAAPVAPAPVAPAAPAPAEPQKKKSHAGLIIGLVFGITFVVFFVAFGIFFIFNGTSRLPSGSGTILDRIETMEEISSGKNYTVYDKAFDKKIESAKWWDYDGTMKNQGVYFSNTKTLAFSIKVDEKVDEKLYFAYYYSKDNDFDKDELKDPIYGITTGPSYYKDGNAFYNIECEKSIKPGYYCVIVSKDKSFKRPYVVAYAKVIDETAEVPDAKQPDQEDPGDEAQA